MKCEGIKQPYLEKTSYIQVAYEIRNTLWLPSNNP